MTALDKRLFSFAGMLQTMFVAGPALGYVFGGMFLGYYTDIDVLEAGEEITISASSEHWIGAWWIGFVLAWLMAWGCAFFIGMYPAVLPGAGKHNQVRFLGAMSVHATMTHNTVGFSG